MKERIIAGQQWDLNICCGKADADKQFKNVLCSHTIEHVEKPDLFFRELHRVGETIAIILPPLWDIFAAFNFVEHKWIFLSISANIRINRSPFLETSGKKEDAGWFQN